MEPDLVLANGGQAVVLELMEILPAIYCIASGTQGWMPWFGRLYRSTSISLIIGGLLIALPDLAAIGISIDETWLNIAGLAIIILCLLGQQSRATI